MLTTQQSSVVYILLKGMRPDGQRLHFADKCQPSLRTFSFALRLAVQVNTGQTQRGDRGREWPAALPRRREDAANGPRTQ